MFPKTWVLKAAPVHGIVIAKRQEGVVSPDDVDFVPHPFPCVFVFHVLHLLSHFYGRGFGSLKYNRLE